MSKGAWIGTIAGFGAGFAVAALLHNYPKQEVTRHRHCQVCGDYEETYREGTILGGRSEYKMASGGPVEKMLREAVGDHDHRFSEWTTVFPTFGVEQERPEIAAQLVRIQEVEENPHLIAGLEQAMRADKERTVKLLQTFLDPAANVPISVLIPFMHDGTIEERWAKSDAELAKPAKSP